MLWLRTIKFGHINSDELIQALPEFDSANVKLEKFRKELINALELMSVELNNKSDAYNKESKNYTDIVKQTKEQELVDMNRRIQEFQKMLSSSCRKNRLNCFSLLWQKLIKQSKMLVKKTDLFIFSISDRELTSLF